MGKKKTFEFEIQYTKAAEKFFQVHEEVRNQYEDAIKELLTGEHPETVHVRRIQGKRNDYFRIRLGAYRVIYTVINGKIITVSTLLAGARGDVYKKTTGLK